MDFIDLAFCPISRTNEVYRYSSVYQEKQESLSDHITEVCMMSYLIARHLNKFETVSIGDLLEKCLLHDLEEVVTGDIPRNTKYATKSSKESLSEVSEKAISHLEESCGITFSSVWWNAKKGKDGTILKIVDMLVVAKKCITEIELRNNLSFLKVVSELETHLTNTLISLVTCEEFESQKSLDFLTNIVRQAREEIVRLRVKYCETINKYHIKENVIKGE